MTYLLDTNIVIALLNNRPAIARDRLRQCRAVGNAIGLPAIVLFELWYGVFRSQHVRENTARLRVFLSAEIALLSFDDEDAAIAGRLRADLARAGTPIGPYDVMIAAQALRAGAILVTANAGEFSRVERLTCEDWTIGG